MSTEPTSRETLTASRFKERSSTRWPTSRPPSASSSPPERQLKDELAKPGLSDGARQETENQLKQVRYEIGVATTASNLVLTNYDRMVLDGKLEGLGTFAKDTALGLLALSADVAMVKYSPEARARLQDRATALLTTLAAPTEIIRDIQRTYDYADVLEQRGEITAAAALRTETDLALASTLSGVGGAARGVVVGIETLAGTTGKLIAKAESLVAKSAGKAADLFDPKSGQVSSGTGTASAAADAEAGAPNIGPWQEIRNNQVVTKWPLNEGFNGVPEPVTLKPGTIIDRYGDNLNADFFAPAGTPIEARAMAPGSEARPYVKFEVLKPLDANAGEIAPWFGQPGGGTQFKTNRQLRDLIAQGYLKEIK